MVIDALELSNLMNFAKILQLAVKKSLNQA